MAIDKRYINIKEACNLLGIGKTKAREWLVEIGAKRCIGRCVRYDIFVIEKEMEVTQSEH